jgi:hypothetical protein
LAHSKQFDSPTRNRPVAEFIDSSRERGQRDGMKRENYLPINILRTENLPLGFTSRKLTDADDGDRQEVDILTAMLTDGLPAVEAACVLPRPSMPLAGQSRAAA